MRALIVRCLLAAAVAATVAAPAASAAGAAGSSQVITDCNSHGQLSRQYSVGALRGALATLPADVKEYTDCYDVIQRALLTQVGGSKHTGSGSGGSGSGGSFLSTPLIVVLVLLALGGGGFAAAAARRRSAD